ncbi:hypothetical protein MP638_001660, partial [Amoeboaphelidium occidentale]
MTDQQQLDKVEAEIAAIQPKIDAKEKELMIAKDRLEKAQGDSDIQRCSVLLQSATAELTRLSQKEAMLMEWMLRIKEKMDDNDGGNHAGRLFEHTFRQSFIKALFND